MAEELIRCPACDHALRLPTEFFGQTVECPQCGNRFQAPVMGQPPVVRPVEQLTEIPTPERDFNRSRVAERLRGPAIALLLSAILSLVCNGIGLVYARWIDQHPQQIDAELDRRLDENPDLDREQRQQAKEIALQLLSSLNLCCGGSAIANLLVLVGAIQMLRVRSYGFAVLASILALNPVNFPVCFVHVPFGVWSLAVLSNADVRSTFRPSA
jgi:hypothetical protein